MKKSKETCRTCRYHLLNSGCSSLDFNCIGCPNDFDMGCMCMELDDGDECSNYEEETHGMS